MPYTLHAIGVTKTVRYDLTGAIEVARQIDNEYQRFGGVDVVDVDGNVVANVDNDVITRYED